MPHAGWIRARHAWKAHRIESKNEISALLELWGSDELFRDVDLVASSVSRRTTVKAAHPQWKAERVGHPAKKVYVLLLHHEVVIVDRDRLIGSRPQAQRFHLDIPVIKVRRKIGIISLNSQCRCLRGNANRPES